MTTEQKKAMAAAVKKADAVLEKNPTAAVAEAKAKLGLDKAALVPAAPKAEVKEAKPPKAPKAPKVPKVKKLAAGAVEVDTSEYVKAHNKLPGAGKRDPNAKWKFTVGAKTLEFAAEFYRVARQLAVEAAVEANVAKITVVA